MSDSKKDTERKKKEMLEKLKNGDFTVKAEPPLLSHGSFWEHLLRIKCSNNEYQPFVECRICNYILSYSISNGTSSISYHDKIVLINQIEKVHLTYLHYIVTFLYPATKKITSKLIFLVVHY